MSRPKLKQIWHSFHSERERFGYQWWNRLLKKGIDSLRNGNQQRRYLIFSLVWVACLQIIPLDCVLQLNQVNCTPQDYINELIIWILNPLVVLQCVFWNQGHADNENQSDGRTKTIESNIFKSCQSNVRYKTKKSQLGLCDAYATSVSLIN